MVDLSTKKPPFSNEEIGDSLLDYILSEASNEPTENTAEVLTNEMIDRLLLDAILGKGGTVNMRTLRKEKTPRTTVRRRPKLPKESES